MNAAALAGRLDDLLNPIAVKELRQVVKSRIVISALMLFLIVQLSVLFLLLMYDVGRAGNLNMDAGRHSFRILQGILLGTCLVLVPLYAGIRLSAERSDTNVDLLFISTLRPRGIIAGKLQAAVVLILLIFSACAPFMTFTYLMRGIDIPTIVLVLVLDFLVVLLCTQAAIFLGTVPANLGFKLLLGLAGIGLLFGAFSLTLAGSIELLDIGLGSSLDRMEFWLSTGSVAAALLAATGLLFTWSTALVSPPSFNRSLSVRLCLLGFWLLTGAAAALLSHRFRSLWPLYIWEMPMVLLLSAQILVSINEREQWGARVARTIPRRWWLRGPAFLLYSGAAGGVLFSALLLLLTFTPVFITVYNWPDRSTLARMNEAGIGRRYTITLLLVSLYTFDYCMSAVWLRQVLLSKWIKPSLTWVVALVLFALGTALPWPLLFYFQYDRWNMNHIDPVWQISNPFSTIYAFVVEGDTDVEFWSVWILSAWGLIVMACCLPWMVRQAGRFRPSEPEVLETASLADTSGS